MRIHLQVYFFLDLLISGDDKINDVIWKDIQMFRLLAVLIGQNHLHSENILTSDEAQ